MVERGGMEQGGAAQRAAGDRAGAQRNWLWIQPDQAEQLD